MTLEETLQDFIVSTRQLFAETDRRFAETDRRFAETDRRFDKAREQFVETERKIDKLQGLFTSQWGKLVEAMVQPAALELFRARGIEVVETMQRVVVKRNGMNKEFDIILVDGDVVVVVEVKSTLKVDHVRAHVEALGRFFDYLPEHRGKRVLGAMAYIACDEQADRYAVAQGLYVVGMTGENLVAIHNDEDFVPRDFARG